MNEPTRWVIPLRDATNPNFVGVKASTLGRLLVAGFPVPDGFVLVAHAAPDLKGEPQLGSAATEAVRAAVRAYSQTTFAVRSSSLAEDLAGASHAGLYETVLDVRGEESAIRAVETCLSSARGERVNAYHRAVGGEAAPMAVLMQQQVSAVASGVAFTTKPVTGERDVVRVSAVRGAGERLVSSAADADEWEVRGNSASLLRAPEQALTPAKARAVAGLAQRVQAHFGGVPQDIEWAFDREGDLHLLQARPITALPDPVVWASPAPGGWVRYLRFGEWLCEPLTPLFADWAIARLDTVFWRELTRCTSLPTPKPTHVLVNGWYFGSLNFWPHGIVKTMLHILRHPRVMRVFLRGSPALVERVTREWQREWRDEGLPELQRVVGGARARLDATADVRDHCALVDDLIDAAGCYFVWVVLVAGVAWNTEIPFGEFHRRRLRGKIGGSHLDFLIGLGALDALRAHAVTSFDWVHPPIEEAALQEAIRVAGERRAGLDVRRAEAESSARAALRGRVLRKFERLLEIVRRYARLREEVIAPLTAGWPLLRRALLEVGRDLKSAGTLGDEADVFFLTRAELEGAGDLRTQVEERKKVWQRQRRLTPPGQIGTAPRIWQLAQRMMPRAFGGAAKAELPADAARGIPASPGRATGPARIVRGPEEFARVRDGDVLIAPATAPAWTPLFAHVAAVVTDTGSPMAHASLVAREYGIPAVVGTGDVTRRFRDGELVTVDGAAGAAFGAK